MGRIGGCGAKTRTEDCKSLAIGKMRQYSGLQVGYAGSLSWHRNGCEVGSVGYQVVAGGVRLHYTSTPLGGLPIACDYQVRVTYSWLTSGGRRPWWLCPLRGCGRRCGVLYLPPGAHYFGCRRCYDLAYRSQQERTATRDPWLGLLRTSWGRKILAEVEAERATAAQPKPLQYAPAPLVKRPRGRPRTKRKYTRRSLLLPTE